MVPALGLLEREVQVGPAYAESVGRLTEPVVALVDARHDLPAARDLTRVLREHDER